MIPVNRLTSLMNDRSSLELAVGFLRYEALRKLNPRQYSEICARNLKGENFDTMIDDLLTENP